MNTFEKIIEIGKDDRIKLGSKMRELLHKELFPGMTRYVCRNGTLSDGFEKITPAQRYAQATKEIYIRSCEVKRLQSQAKINQAILIKAEKKLKINRLLKLIKIPVDTLTAEANVEIAQENLLGNLVSCEDTLRQLDEFSKVRKELQTEVLSKYPNGLEDAEEDNWKAVARYRADMRLLGYDNQPQHVPLEMHEKAKIGLETGISEYKLFLEHSESNAISILADGNMSKYLQMRDCHLAMEKKRIDLKMTLAHGGDIIIDENKNTAQSN